MTGKEHMIVGTTATATLGISLAVTQQSDIVNFVYLFPLVIGGFIGSYMPDIDSNNSTASRLFNKILFILVIALLIGYIFGLSINVSEVLDFLQVESKDYIGIGFFVILTILGKFSPHRMFTHKWLGTVLFCYSVYLMGNRFFTIGFIMGYVLHIVCDRFTPRGKNLKFFEFKLPCKNSKNKTTIDW